MLFLRKLITGIFCSFFREEKVFTVSFIILLFFWFIFTFLFLSFSFELFHHNDLKVEVEHSIAIDPVELRSNGIKCIMYKMNEGKKNVYRNGKNNQREVTMVTRTFSL